MRASRIRERSKRNALQVFDFKTALRDQRISLGLSERDLAERMGVAAEFVHEFERYDGNPTLRDVQRYACAVDSLIELSITSDAEDN